MTGIEAYVFGFASGMVFGLFLAYIVVPAVVTYYRAVERRYIPAARREIPVRRRHGR